MQNVTGQVVVGDDFFDRKSEIARFWESLKTDNLLLLAPRRVGKSSVLRSMAAGSAEMGFTGIFVDVSDCSDELRFVERLYSRIIEHHGAKERLWNGIKESWLGKTVSQVKKVGVSGFGIEFTGDDPQWSRMGEDLAEALNNLEGRTLIQIDELPVFVLKLLNRGDETAQGRVREFLYWLRRLRQSYPQVRWMLAGSIGLDTVAARLNIADAINDLRIETLGAFDDATAHELLQHLSGAYELAIEENVRKHILARVGWLIPFYLQLIFHEVRSIKKPTVADVDKAVNTLLDPSHKGLFDYWRQRLFDELGRPDAEHSATLLHHACRVPEGVRRTIFKQALTRSFPDVDTRDDKLRYLLDVLANDGYLVEADKRWQFRSPFLREYWLRRVAPPEADDE